MEKFMLSPAGSWIRNTVPIYTFNATGLINFVGLLFISMFENLHLSEGMDHTMDLEPGPNVLSGSHTGCWIQKTVAHDIVNRKGHILVK